MQQAEDLLQLLKSRIPTFSKGHKKIAFYLLENYDKADYETSLTLGKAVGVSESTVVRFAKELGYSRYHDFQHALDDLVRHNLTTVQRINYVCDKYAQDKGSFLYNMMKKDADQIYQTLEQMDERVFNQAVEAILEADRIYILAGRSSSSLAGFMGHYFNLIFEKLKIINDSSAEDAFDYLHRVKEKDVVIGISFPRYSRKTIKAIQYANAQGAKIITITDGMHAPITKYADYALTACSGMASFVDSLVAPLSLINALITAICIEKKNELSQTFLKLENIWTEANVYAVNDNDDI